MFHTKYRIWSAAVLIYLAAALTLPAARPMEHGQAEQGRQVLMFVQSPWIQLRKFRNMRTFPM